MMSPSYQDLRRFSFFLIDVLVGAAAIKNIHKKKKALIVLWDRWTVIVHLSFAAASLTRPSKIAL